MLDALVVLGKIARAVSVAAVVERALEDGDQLGPFVAVAGDRVEISAPPEPGLRLPYVRPARPFLEYEFWQHGQQIPVHRAMPILRGLFGADWVLPATV